MAHRECQPKLHPVEGVEGKGKTVGLLMAAPCTKSLRGSSGAQERERWVVSKRQRCDINEGGDTEVTVISSEELHTKAERAKKNRKEKRRLHPVGAQRKTQNRKMVLRHGGVPLVAESEVGRRPKCTG